MASIYEFKEFWAKTSIGLNFAGLSDIAAFGV
jgi:hypothetical protein